MSKAARPETPEPGEFQTPRRVCEDLTTKGGKFVTILNPKNYPIVVNELGQALGGGKFAKISATDKVSARVLDRKMIYVVS